MFKDFFLLAINNLRRRKLRSWLTMIGIFIGITAVVSLISLGQGLQTAITGQFSTLSINTLTIQNAGTGFGPPGSTVVEKLNQNDVEVIEKVNGVKIVVPRIVKVVRVDYNNAASFKYVADIPKENDKREMIYDSLNLDAEKGRLLEGNDYGKVVLGSNIAEGNQFEKKIEVGKSIIIQGEEFEVIGILEKASNFQINDAILMLNDDLEELLGLENEIDLIIARISDNEDPEEIALRIEKALRKDRNLEEGKEDFSVETPLQAISTVNQVLSIIQIVVVGIALISIIVGGIGVANTMYTSVLERKKEIGTMKAIGAKNSDILWIFLIESGMLGFIGGLIGVILGASSAIGLSSVANNYFGSEIITVNLSIILIISVLVFSFLLGVLFGAIPSYQASKLRPIEALRE